MSHTYDFDKFEEVIARISASYIEECFGALYETLAAEIIEKT